MKTTEEFSLGEWGRLGGAGGFNTLRIVVNRNGTANIWHDRATKELVTLVSSPVMVLGRQELVLPRGLWLVDGKGQNQVLETGKYKNTELKRVFRKAVRSEGGWVELDKEQAAKWVDARGFVTRSQFVIENMVRMNEALKSVSVNNDDYSLVFELKDSGKGMDLVQVYMDEITTDVVTTKLRVKTGGQLELKGDLVFAVDRSEVLLEKGTSLTFEDLKKLLQKRVGNNNVCV